jgi:hypothetical protein
MLNGSWQEKKTHFPASMWVRSYPSYEYFLNVHILQGCGITDAVIIGGGTLDMMSENTVLICSADFV